MNWSKSHLVRWSVEILAFLCFLALYAPWFILGSAIIDRGSIMLLYAKLALLTTGAWALAHRLKPRLEHIDETIRQRATLFIVVIGFVLVIVVIVWPALYLSPSVPAFVGYLLLGLVAWTIGVRKSFAFYKNYQMQQQLFLGTMSVAMCFIIASRMGLAHAVYLRSLPFIIFWLPAATIATGLLRAFELQGMENTERLRSWLNPMFKIIGVCLIISAFAGGIAPWLFQYLKIPLLLLWQAVVFVFLFISYCFAYVFQFIFAFVAGLLTDTITKISPPEPPKFVAPEEVERQASFLSPQVMQIIQGVALVIVLLLVARYIFLYLIRTNRSVARKTGEDSRESFTSQQALREWGKRQLRRMASSLRQKAGAFSVRRKQKTAVDIYHLLLLLAARKGIIRPQAMTAHNFQSQLLRGFPKNPGETENIFQAFVRELYAGKEIPLAEIEVLRVDFAQIKKEE